jgi:quercetin dioxygenase-like cupin family protein
MWRRETVDNRASILRLSEVESKELIPKTEARFVHSENMTLAYWKFERGALLPEHEHPHEQMTNVVDGVLELIIEDEPQRLEAGMVAVISPNVRHAGKAVTECHIIDVFHPVREDFR